MIKLVNKNPFDLSVEAFRRYHKLNIEAKGSLDLTDPIDLTKEGARYYETLSPILNFEVHYEGDLGDHCDVERQLWGSDPQTTPVVESTEVESNTDQDTGEDNAPEGDLTPVGEGTSDGEGTEGTGTPDTPDEQPPADVPEGNTPPASNEGEEVPLKDKLAGLELSELKELAKKAGIELKGRVTKASATKALLENEEATLKAL